MMVEVAVVSFFIGAVCGGGVVAYLAGYIIELNAGRGEG